MKPISVAQLKIKKTEAMKKLELCSSCQPRYENRNNDYDGIQGYFCNRNTEWTLGNNPHFFDEGCTKEDKHNCPILKAQVPSEQYDSLLEYPV